MTNDELDKTAYETLLYGFKINFYDNFIYNKK
jgi:hypothetical protein